MRISRRTTQSILSDFGIRFQNLIRRSMFEVQLLGSARFTHGKARDDAIAVDRTQDEMNKIKKILTLTLLLRVNRELVSDA